MTVTITLDAATVEALRRVYDLTTTPHTPFAVWLPLYLARLTANAAAKGKVWL
jgi:hypothetical protein